MTLNCALGNISRLVTLKDTTREDKEGAQCQRIKSLIDAIISRHGVSVCPDRLKFIPYLFLTFPYVLASLCVTFWNILSTGALSHKTILTLKHTHTHTHTQIHKAVENMLHMVVSWEHVNATFF
jgi:hypothetical protein